MRATGADAPPQGEDWAHEVKWDGMRIIVRCAGGSTSLHTSNGLDATGRFPEFAALDDAVGCELVLDGEIIAQDGDGRPDFGRLQHRMHVFSPAEVARRAAEVPVSLAIFDVLWLDGHDLCPLPWRDRRAVLDQLVERGPSWRVSAVHDDGPALLTIAKDRGLEGIVSKRLDSSYQPGKRSPSWRKVKVRLHQEFVVGGWWPGERSREGRLGSLIVGVNDVTAPGRPLRFAGKVGTGFTEPDLVAYEALLADLATDRCPFEPQPPRPITSNARWVRPEIVVEVAFAEWTAEGVLRHPAHLGRRLDKSPAEVVHE